MAMRRPVSVPTTNAATPAGTLCVSSHRTASRSAPPAARMTATVSGRGATASDGPKTSIATARSSARTCQNPRNASEMAITHNRDTVILLVARLDCGGESSHFMGVRAWDRHQNRTHLATVKTQKRSEASTIADRLAILLGIFSPWDGISLTYRQFAAELGKPVTPITIK